MLISLAPPALTTADGIPCGAKSGPCGGPLFEIDVRGEISNFSEFLIIVDSKALVLPPAVDPGHAVASATTHGNP